MVNKRNAMERHCVPPASLVGQIVQVERHVLLGFVLHSCISTVHKTKTVGKTSQMLKIES